MWRRNWLCRRRPSSVRSSRSDRAPRTSLHKGDFTTVVLDHGQEEVVKGFVPVDFASLEPDYRPGRVTRPDRTAARDNSDDCRSPCLQVAAVWLSTVLAHLPAVGKSGRVRG